MISSKSLKYTVRILLGTLIGVYLGIIVLLNIPYVQGKLSVFVTKELKNILNTEVSIGRIDMGLLNASLWKMSFCMTGESGDAESSPLVGKIRSSSFTER